MADSKKSKPRSRSKRSRLNYQDKAEEYGSSNSESNDVQNSSYKQDRRRSAKSQNEFSKHETRSDSCDAIRKTISPQIKSLVTVPLPSLLTSSPIVASGNRNMIKAKVVSNRAGSQKKGLVAKSLMDLQFMDRGPNSYDRIERKPGLLPEPYDMLQQDLSVNRRKIISSDRNNSKVMEGVWNPAKDAMKMRRSWTEKEAVSTQSIFSSSYSPLVVESEPLEKIRKTQKSPKPLLESKILPSLSLTTPRSMLSSRSLLKKVPHDESHPSRANVSAADNSSLDSTHHPNSIIKITGERKNTSFLVIPSTLPWVHLHGRAKIKVVKGVVIILAHTLTPGSTYEVFSPSSNCLLSLQVDPVEVMSPDDVKVELRKVMKNHGVPQGLSNKSIGIIEVEKLDSVVCDYVTMLPPFTKLFTSLPPADSKKSQSAGVTLFNGGFKLAPESEMGVPCMNWDDNYNEALDRWLETIDKCGSGDQSPVFLSCGAKNAGKSMFNRCAINTTLRSVPEVAYLDCDVGQTEFSPPASLSLHIINKPVLSPPFCHQRQAEKLVFYGDVSPAQDPAFYVKCLHHIIQAYKELAQGKKLPLIINTMGFPEGVGFMLFVDTLNITRPDLVVQFECDQLYSNLPLVTQEMIALDEGWTFNKFPPPNMKERVSQVKEHTLRLVSSLNYIEKNAKSSRLHPADLRNLTMISALSQGLGENETLMSLTPYTMSYHRLAIHMCRHTIPVEEILTAIEASVVALCEADLTQAKRSREDLPLTFDAMPVCNCLGLGIVRALDCDKGLLYVSTTLPRHLLKRVNTLLKGTLALPDHFIMKQQHTSAYPVPYVDSLAQATATFGLRTRSRMPRGQVHALKTI